jgi:hypothetical protein
VRASSRRSRVLPRGAPAPVTEDLVTTDPAAHHHRGDRGAEEL